MGTNNAINLKAMGLAYYDGAGTFTTPSLTQFAVVIGDANNDVTSVGSLGTSGQVLTSNGAGMAPSWTSVATSITTINGDSGSITGSTVTIKAGVSTLNSGSSVSFVNSGTTSTFNVTDANANTIVGLNAGKASITGTNNTAFGSLSAAALTTGGSNVAIGYNALHALTTGASNIAIGTSAGSSYTAGESNNILLGNTGTAAESATIRIGTAGTQTACFIVGIEGVSVSNTQMVTINTVTNQLGSQAIPAGTVTSVSGTVNRITSTGGATPVIDISAAYVGQTSLTTLGTITTGTWNGTTIGTAFGGTGDTTFTPYSVIVAGTTAMGSFQNVVGVGTLGQVLMSNGASALPSWSGSGGTFWNDITTASVNPMVAGQGYIADQTTATGRLILTLPATPALGDTFNVTGRSNGTIPGANNAGWEVLTNGTSQIIILGTSQTALAGNIQSTNQTDSVRIVCTHAAGTSSEFTVVDCMGNITIN